MTLKEFRNKPIVKILTNRYVLITIIFMIWMLFFDGSSILLHNNLDKETKRLENSNDFYQDGINQDKKKINNLKHPDSLEKFAREEYKMKKKNEDIYIIEFDTLKK